MNCLTAFWNNKMHQQKIPLKVKSEINLEGFEEYKRSGDYVFIDYLPKKYNPLQTPHIK